MPTFQEFTANFLSELTPLYEGFSEKFGSILLAIVLLAFGILLGKGVEKVFRKISQNKWIFLLSNKSGFAELLKKAGINTPAVEIIGKFLNGYIITLFVLSASKVLEIVAISEFLQSVLTYIPKIVVALVIVLFGTKVAGTVSSVIGSGFALMESESGKILALVAKGVITTFSILAALVYLEIAPVLINVLFIGFVSMITIAGGLAFGLGGKQTVEKFLEDLRQNKEEKK